MKKKKPTERELVNRLIKAIKANTREPVYVFVDRDSGVQRHTKSGWDFCLTWKGRTVFIEAKVKTKQSDFQKLTQKEIEAAGGTYLLLHFEAADVAGGFSYTVSRYCRAVAFAHAEDFFPFDA